MTRKEKCGKMYYRDDIDELLVIILVFIVVVALMFLGDGLFAKNVAQPETIQFMGYDDRFFIVTVSEEGETRFDVDFKMYERLEVGQ
ncbi:MAG: hypothetical protein ACW99U_22100, partial [Candidatus Thorarchaeota archaeon]